MDRYTKWVAKYGTNDGTAHQQPSIEGMDIWQYTSKGKINGISGNVDMNFCYRDFPAEIRPVRVSGEEETKTEQRVYAHKLGEHVVFSTCYRSSADPISKQISAESMSRNHGVITRIVDARNPYLLDDGLCWVNDGDIRGKYTEPKVNYYTAYTGSSVSIVDALQAIGVDSSFENRKQIAQRNGISEYEGSAEQNNKLIVLVKQGKLVK